MKKCIIIGGGFAGLSAASFLADSGFEVELIESSPKLGGRAYSFYDENFGCEIDNGQHILMGCYQFTLEFLKLIGVYGNLSIQKKLTVNFLDKNGKQTNLKSSFLPYPFNLLWAILNYKAISFNERLSILRFFCKLPFISSSDIKDLSVDEWLKKENQNENVISALWELVSVSALNTSIKKANAKIFRDILYKIFFMGNFSSLIILPKFGLSKTYCEGASAFIKEMKGVIFTSENVTGLIITDNVVKEIITTKRSIKDFDIVISTVPQFAINRFFPEINNYISDMPAINYSSILSVHLKILNNPLKENFYAFISSPVHWVFNHNNYITVVISDADTFMDKNKEELISLIKQEIKKYLKIEGKSISDYKIIKEKRATFIPSRQILETRPDFKTKIENFYLAGDWINTNLPSTIESAVKSAKLVSNHIKKQYS